MVTWCTVGFSSGNKRSLWMMFAPISRQSNKGPFQNIKLASHLLSVRVKQPGLAVGDESGISSARSSRGSCGIWAPDNRLKDRSLQPCPSFLNESCNSWACWSVNSPQDQSLWVGGTDDPIDRPMSVVENSTESGWICNLCNYWHMTKHSTSHEPPRWFIEFIRWGQMTIFHQWVKMWCSHWECKYNSTRLDEIIPRWKPS